MAGHPPAASAETRPTAFRPTPNSVRRFAIAAMGIGLVVSAAALAGRGLSASTLLLTTLLAVLAVARFGGTRAGFAVSLAGIVAAAAANRAAGISFLDIVLLALACGLGSLACGRYKRLEISAAARAEAETALREKEAELQLIVDAIPALLAYVRRDQHYGLVNRTYERWFGLKPADLRGKPMQTVLGREGLAAIQPYIDRTLRGEAVQYEQRLDFPHGPSRWVEANYAPRLDEAGRVLGYVSLVQDITERKRIEEELADTLARYRFLSETMPQIVWTARSDGAIETVNGRWTKETGLSIEQSLGFGWVEALHPDDRERTRIQWEKATKTKTPYEIENRLWCAAESRHHWHLCRATPFFDATGQLVQWVGTSTDIDAQRRAYAELSEAREELRRHAADLEARVNERTANLREANAQLEAFTYSVSHDLRTPLQFIQGFSEALIEDKQNRLTPESEDYVRRITRSASRMDAIIQDLLAYSRLARSELKLVDLPLRELLTEVLAHHQSAIQAKAAQITIAEPLPVVRADHTGTFQAVSNLLSNALKFVPPQSAPSIRVYCETRAESTRLWVEDKGVGIRPEHQERIFRMFERLHTSGEYPGTGIGLSLVRKAVERMGGRCGVESTLGAGSRFWIDFPTSPKTERASDAG